MIETRAEIALYRSHTIGMLRRYFRMSLEVGRLPSILGREFFRTRVTHYRTESFEDRIILVHDVEKCLARLTGFEQALIGAVVLQELSHDEAARRLGCCRKTVTRRLVDALDQLAEVFLQVGLLREMQIHAAKPAKPCQEAETAEFRASA
jgi:predicted DNA-binding protein (UPF0251 family)